MNKKIFLSTFLTCTLAIFTSNGFFSTKKITCCQKTEHFSHSLSLIAAGALAQSTATSILALYNNDEKSLWNERYLYTTKGALTTTALASLVYYSGLHTKLNKTSIHLFATGFALKSCFNYLTGTTVSNTFLHTLSKYFE